MCPQHDESNSFMSNAALENHCTQTAGSSRIGCCRQRHNIYRLSVYTWLSKKVIFGNILLLQIFYAFYCHLYYPAVCLLNKDLFELSLSRYSTWVMQKRGLFFLKKGWKAFLFMFWNICLLKCKILVQCTLMRKRSKSEGSAFWKSFKLSILCAYFYIYPLFWPSDRVIDCIQIDYI